jgi:hypothetical protein
VHRPLVKSKQICGSRPSAWQGPPEEESSEAPSCACAQGMVGWVQEEGRGRGQHTAWSCRVPARRVMRGRRRAAAGARMSALMRSAACESCCLLLLTWEATLLLLLLLTTWPQAGPSLSSAPASCCVAAAALLVRPAHTTWAQEKVGHSLHLPRPFRGSHNCAAAGPKKLEVRAPAR